MIGLGNPGSAYEKTRHNIGFRAVRVFGKKQGIGLKKDRRISAEIGRGDGVGLVLPMTYMNSSGEAVKAAVKLFKVPLKQMMIVVDDVALPFGVMKLKEGGSSGGHNGLKSIEEHLKTVDYPRLRLGLGSPQRETLADYVLGKFEPAEEILLPQVFEKTADVLDCWMKEGIQAAMKKANTGEKNG